MNLDLQFYVNMFFSFLDFAGLTLLSLTIYRIPILLYWKRLLFIQFIFLIVMLFHDVILMNKDFYTLSIALSAIILTTFILRIPFLYSSLIWGTGYLIYIILQGIVILGVTATGLLSMSEIVNDPFFRNLIMFVCFAINMTIVYFMEKKRLGFMFIMNRFRLQKRNIQLKDIFIASLFVCTVSLGQLGFVSIVSNNLNESLLIILVTMMAISIIGLYITYKFNMKEIDERFSSLRGKNR